MPILTSAYRPPLPFRNAHFATIYSAKLRRAPKIDQERERIELPDSDFVDVDWSFSQQPSNHLVLLLHGLEGNAQRPYIIGQAAHLNVQGIDVAALNFRGCSGTPNRHFESYNAGKTDDLHQVLLHILETRVYRSISLIGFSLGGNMTLKYLGEQRSIPSAIKCAMVVSTPLDLHGSLQALDRFFNGVYRHTFLRYLRKKYKQKKGAFPELLPVSEKEIRSLLEFDEHYTAPAHGFSSALEYYGKNSSMHFLPNISHPVYILNALNDTFLSPNCYPTALASQAKNLYLETPVYGGHVGFYAPGNTYYNEARAYEFLKEQLL